MELERSFEKSKTSPNDKPHKPTPLDSELGVPQLFSVKQGIKFVFKVNSGAAGPRPSSGLESPVVLQGWLQLTPDTAGTRWHGAGSPPGLVAAGEVTQRSHTGVPRAFPEEEARPGPGGGGGGGGISLLAVPDPGWNPDGREGGHEGWAALGCSGIKGAKIQVPGGLGAAGWAAPGGNAEWRNWGAGPAGRLCRARGARSRHSPVVPSTPACPGC